jgi:hypothetical protein
LGDTVPTFPSRLAAYTFSLLNRLFSGCATTRPLFQVDGLVTLRSVNKNIFVKVSYLS